MPAELPNNRAADPANKDILERASPYSEHYWQGSRYETWYLDLLAVDPSCQGRGHGRLLIGWGLEKAAQDGICASLISSDFAEQFYVRASFVPVGWATEGPGNPLAGLKGGRVMFHDVRG